MTATRTLPIGTSERLFARLHRRMVDAGSPPPPWDRLDPAALGDAEREEARAAWSARAVAEYRSMVVFAELLPRFGEAGLPLEVTSAAARLITDEARHTELCAGMAERLGGHADARLDPRDLRLMDTALPAHLFVARWTVSMFCVGESASVGLLQSLAAHTTDPCARAVVATLLRDETLHDRFGWALARLVVPRLSDAELDWLGADLAHAFAHYDRLDGACLRGDGEGASVPPGPAPARPNMGVVPREYFARAFYDRLDRVILPSLAALGVPAYEAWALRHEAARATGATDAGPGDGDG